MTDLRNSQSPDEALDVEAAGEATDEQRKKTSLLAIAVMTVEDEIAALTAAIAEKNTLLKKLTETDLPEAMTAIGQAEFTLLDGTKVELKDVCRASIPKDAQEDGFAYLEAVGAGDLIKHQVVISFGKGEDAWARKFLNDCAKRKRPLNAERFDWVEPPTLSSYVRELVKKGTDLAAGIKVGDATLVPKRVLGVYQTTVAKLSRPKKPALK